MSTYHHADCMNPETGLPSFPDKHFDLAIVDVPYGIGEDGGTNGSRGKIAKAKTFEAKGWDKIAPKLGFKPSQWVYKL